MRRLTAFSVLSVSLTLVPVVLVSADTIDVKRESDENPVVEVARATLAGAFAGLLIGYPVSQLENGAEDRDIMRASVLAGALIGLAAGVVWTQKRPQPKSVIEIEKGEARLAPVAPTLKRDGSLALRLVAVGF